MQTLQEAGVAGHEASVWLALLAPAGTPRVIVNKLNAKIDKAMSHLETCDALYQEMVRWGKVVKDTGTKLE